MTTINRNHKMMLIGIKSYNDLHASGDNDMRFSFYLYRR